MNTTVQYQLSYNLMCPILYHCVLRDGHENLSKLPHLSGLLHADSI